MNVLRDVSKGTEIRTQKITFVKSGFVSGGYTPTLEHYDEEMNVISI